MKAYQVFTGESDKHGRQRFDLVSTYLDRDRALTHCKKLIDLAKLQGEMIEESEFFCDGMYKDWDALGWDRVTLVRFMEISITV